jgi:hypothetical protein
MGRSMRDKAPLCAFLIDYEYYHRMDGDFIPHGATLITPEIGWTWGLVFTLGCKLNLTDT